jgi:hypothetical protein
VLKAGQVQAMGQNEHEATGEENEDEPTGKKNEDEASTSGENQWFHIGVFSWLNHHQGTDKTRWELGTGQKVLVFLPNRRSRLIDNENGRHRIS